MRRAYPQFLDRRPDAAAGDPPGHLPADLLGSDPEACGGARPRSVSGRGADRAGVDVRSGDSLRRQRLGADADRAGHRPPPRALARDPPIHDPDADQSRDQRAPRHAVLLAPGRSSSAAPTTRSPATTPARTASSAGRPSARASTRTSSSTTSRSPRPRTTSSASSAPPKTTASCMARAAAARFPSHKPSGN